MRSRVVRLTLTLLAVGAIAAAAYLAWAAEQRAAATRRSAATFENTRMTALRDAFELRAAQQAYVAAGQSEAFWFEKVTTSVQALRTTLNALGTTGGITAADAAVEAASDALQDFEQIDSRARRYVTTGQNLLASDTIFSDGFDTTGRITGALEQAGHAVHAASTVAEAEARREQALAAGGATVAVVIALLLLTGVPSAPAAPMPAAESVRPDPLSLDLGTVVRDEPPARFEAPAPATPPPPRVEIQGLAAVCTDLARLSDTSALPQVLEKAAATLDASGLVLWIADPDGKELLPVATHGYPGGVVARLGTLQVDAENATASAFRTGIVQTVKADTMSHGAIAAPLVTPAGSRGVMAAEVRHDGETDPEKLAAASIVAAQLAALIGPAPVGERSQELGARS